MCSIGSTFSNRAQTARAMAFRVSPVEVLAAKYRWARMAGLLGRS